MTNVESPFLIGIIQIVAVVNKKAFLITLVSTKQACLPFAILGILLMDVCVVIMKRTTGETWCGRSCRNCDHPVLYLQQKGL